MNRLVSRAAMLAVLGLAWVFGIAPVAIAQFDGEDGEGEGPFTVPAGFEVTRYADDDLANNIFSMTIDHKGRIVVAGRDGKGGYVKVLHDTDGDGVADKATEFARVPKSGAHGLVFDGPNLIATGDNSVMRLFDRDGDGVADNADKPEVWTNLRNPEHGANGLSIGPDGWVYLICGNDAGVSMRHANMPGSPVKQPEMGALIRFAPDAIAEQRGWKPGQLTKDSGDRPSEVVAHGFRNPYDHCINEQGQVFTVDADGERDHHLPWYTPTRLFDIAAGKHHGWVLRGWKRSWNRPEHFFDNVERLLEVGRGSPTGLTAYHHRQFPKKYRGGIFYTCWTLGHIYYFPLTRTGSGYASERTIFMSTAGDEGFAPVDIAVGPAGDLFVAVGGRGTRGSVFRVRYKAGHPVKPVTTPHNDLTDLVAVLAAPQRLEAWSRHQWRATAKKLGAQPFIDALTDLRLPGSLRSKAVDVLVDVFDGVPFETVDRVIAHNDQNAIGRRDLIARVAWSLGVKGSDPRIGGVLVQLAQRKDPVVARAAYEALLRRPATQSLNVAALPGAGWGDGKDRRLRDLAIMVQSRSPQMREAYNNPKRAVLGLAFALPDRGLSPLKNTATGLRDLRLYLPGLLGSENGREELVIAALAMWDLIDKDRFAKVPADDRRLMVLRLCQLALGDIQLKQDPTGLKTGYGAVEPDAVGDETKAAMVRAFTRHLPQASSDVAEEIARTCGMVNAPTHGFVGDKAESILIDHIAQRLDDRVDAPQAAKDAQQSTDLHVYPDLETRSTDPDDDLHYLFVTARLEGERSPTATVAIASAFARLHAKMESREWHVSRNWPARVMEALTENVKRDPKLLQAIAASKAFGHREHIIFADMLSAEERTRAIGRLIRVAERRETKVGADAWSLRLLEALAGQSDDKVRTISRRLWPNVAMRAALTPLLAKVATADDRGRFLEAIVDANPTVAIAAADALGELSKPSRGAESKDLGTLILALRYFAQDGRNHGRARASLRRLIESWTGEAFAIKDPGKGDARKAYQPIFAWFASKYPEAAADLGMTDSDVQEFAKRLARIDLSKGDALRGRKVFESRSCHLCHAGNSKLGPDLAGAADRFSAADLFAQIIDPDANVSPLYHSYVVETKDGKTIVGIPVYTSPDGTILTTGPGQTARVRGEDFAGAKRSARSLMPRGLLNGLKDQELADLYRYMKTLKK